MPEKILNLWGWTLGAVALAVGGILKVWSGNVFVRKDDFKEHCKATQTACNKMICGKIESMDRTNRDKIEQLRKEQEAVRIRLDSAVNSLSITNSRLSNLIGSFDQYIKNHN